MIALLVKNGFQKKKKKLCNLIQIFNSLSYSGKKIVYLIRDYVFLVDILSQLS